MPLCAGKTVWSTFPKIARAGHLPRAQPDRQFCPDQPAEFHERAVHGLETRRSGDKGRHKGIQRATARSLWFPPVHCPAEISRNWSLHANSTAGPGSSWRKTPPRGWISAPWRKYGGAFWAAREHAGILLVTSDLSEAVTLADTFGRHVRRTFHRRIPAR